MKGSAYLETEMNCDKLLCRSLSLVIGDLPVNFKDLDMGLFVAALQEGLDAMGKEFDKWELGEHGNTTTDTRSTEQGTTHATSSTDTGV